MNFWTGDEPDLEDVAWECGETWADFRRTIDGRYAARRIADGHVVTGESPVDLQDEIRRADALAREGSAGR